MLTVHHLDNSRSQRVLWLLEELGLPYEIVRYQRNPKTMLAPPELRKIHPLGKSPVVTDGDKVLAESGAIIEQLIESRGQGRLAPAPGTPERTRYLYWLHYAEGSAMPPLVLKLIFSRLPAAAPTLIRPIARQISKRAMTGYVDKQVKLHIDFMEQELGKSEWFAGPEFTAADIQMSYPVEVAQARGGAAEGYPNLAAFLSRIHARPAYQRALERGGPFEMLR